MITPPKEIIELFKSTHGAMSVAEGIALYNICLQAPLGSWMELGSHRGKSSCMITAALQEGTRLLLVEPEFQDGKWLSETIEKIVGINEYKNAIGFNTGYSTDVLPTHEGELSFLFVDSGNHGEEIVQSEKPLYENKISKGGIIAFHDINSQFTAVTRCYEQLIGSGNYEPIHINWSAIFEYVQEHDLETGNDSWHQYPELPHPPNFIGALKRL